jgi:hypothetical protein
MSTRQKRSLPFIIVTVLIMSCTLNKAVVPEYKIYGSWVRHITDTQGIRFYAELKIKTDNSFEFILLENVPGHTNSSGKFTLSGDTLTIIKDADCHGDGVYEIVVSENKLAFVAVTDQCTPRVLALQGVWSSK